MSATALPNQANTSQWLPWVLVKITAEQALLLAAATLRILVYIFLSPLNNDKEHFDVIQYIAEHHALPPLGTISLAFHPPLYYLLAVPFYWVSPSQKFVQVLSLIFSLVTLYVCYRLIYGTNLINSKQARLYVFFFVGCLPQFVLFGLYISNDSLAILIGALLALEAWFATGHNGDIHLIWLSILVGLGLLTKATFLAYLPVLFVLVLVIRSSERRAFGKVFASALALVLLAGCIGSYRYVRNYREVKVPFASSLDLGSRWGSDQRVSYRGVASFFDFNLFKLVASPTLSKGTASAYPLLLYGTFWYQHIPESNFVISRHNPLNYLGSAFYILGIIPTIVAVFGIVMLLKESPRILLDFDSSRIADRRRLLALANLAFLFGNLAIVIAGAAKYHVWSLMQGRLLFPSLWGFLLPFAFGCCLLEGTKWPRLTLQFAMEVLFICTITYFSWEILSHSGAMIIPASARVHMHSILGWRSL